MSPDDVVASLRAALHAPGSRVHEQVGRWDSAVARGELSSAIFAEAALRLLETLEDADGVLDMVATEILTRHGDPSALPRLRKVRPRLRPRVALRDWRFEVDRLIDVLEGRAAHRCDCAAEAAHGGPPRGAHWTTEAESSPEPYLTRRRVRCSRCGRLWTVVEEDGYHYPIFRWEAG